MDLLLCAGNANAILMEPILRSVVLLIALWICRVLAVHGALLVCSYEELEATKGQLDTAQAAYGSDSRSTRRIHR